MPLNLVSDLLQDRYTSVLRNTIRVLMAALPLVFAFSFARGDSASELGNVIVFWLAACALYAMLMRGKESWVAPGLVFTLVFFTTWHLVAYGSVRSGGVVGYACAVVAAGIMLRRRLLAAVLLTCLVLLGALTWAEATGLMVRSPSQLTVGATYWVTYAAALLGISICVSTSRHMAQQALRAQQQEFARREEAEREKQRSEDQFAHIFQVSPSGIMVQSVLTRRVIDINPALERMFGYAREEYFAPAHNVLLWVDDDQRTSLLADLLANGRLANREMLCRRRDGGVFNALISSEIGGDPDNRIIVSMVTDISAEKQREAVLMNIARGVSGETGEPFFRVLVESLAQALGADMAIAGEISEDAAGIAVVHSLAAHADGLAAQPTHYLLADTPCGDAALAEDMCFFADGVAEAFPRDSALAAGRFRAYMGMALRDADGAPIGILNALWRTPLEASPDREALLRIFASRANAELIRVRREREILRLNNTLEQRVAARTAELQATNAELESFAYSVSHDLQTPLRGIDGFTALIGEQLKETLSPEQQRMFGRVRINVTRMGELIHDLLGLAKVSKREMNRQPVDVSALASDIAESACHDVLPRRVDVNVLPGLEAHCDRSLARIALENLIGNAVKYTRHCDVALIEIGALPRSSPRAPLVMYIRDNGVGFDMTYADKLFKPFTRLHHEHEFEGSGIGLATVHRILERHGGGVSGSAAPGHGATFYFSFDTQPA